MRDHTFAAEEFVQAMCIADRSGASGRVALTWLDMSERSARPESAWLGCPGAVVVELPVGLGAIGAALEAAATSEADPCMQRLRLPTGQLQWACEGLITALVEESDALLQKRWARLRRFAAHHWPEWFEGVLHRDSTARIGPGFLRDAVAFLLRHAVAVSVAAAEAPLNRWRSEGRERRRMQRLLDAVEYVVQGVFPLETVEERAKDNWWRELAADLDEVSTALEGLAAFEKEAESALARLLECRELATSIGRLASTSIREPGVAEQVLAAARVLVAELDDIAGRQERLRREVAEDARRIRG